MPQSCIPTPHAQHVLPLSVQVRLICRKQFFVRALGMKVASKQHEVARHSQNRARHERSPQTQSVQMPQGDSWANTGILANPLQAR